MEKIFDAAEIKHVADSCVKCGQCLPHCPTYRLSGHEAQSPRGRLDLLRLAVDASPAAPGSALDAIETCLSCAQCERHCPLHLPVTAAIAAHRASHDTGFSSAERTMQRARALKPAATLLRILPDALLALMPQGDLLHAVKHRTQSWRGKQEHRSQSRIRVLTGCTAHALEGDTLDALIKFADHIDMALEVLPAQCCGSLAAHRGHTHQATIDATKLRNQASSFGKTPLIHLNTGCHEHMARSLPNEQVIDAVVWLFGLRHQIRWRPAPTRTVAVHWPCSSNPDHRRALLGLLAAIPGMRVRELDQNAGCCGAAGDHFVRHPTQALAFRASWMDDWAQHESPLVLSSNIGCTLFLGADPGLSATIQHPLVFLASQLESVS